MFRMTFELSDAASLGCVVVVSYTFDAYHQPSSLVKTVEHSTNYCLQEGEHTVACLVALKLLQATLNGLRIPRILRDQRAHSLV